MCGRIRWEIADQKAGSLLILTIDKEGRKHLNGHEPHMRIGNIEVKVLWNLLEEIFTKREKKLCSAGFLCGFLSLPYHLSTRKQHRVSFE